MTHPYFEFKMGPITWEFDYIVAQAMDGPNAYDQMFFRPKPDGDYQVPEWVEWMPTWPEPPKEVMAHFFGEVIGETNV